MKNRPTVHFASGFDTPEALLAIRSDAPRGLHIDALNAAISRAEAVTELLAHALSDLEEGLALGQKTLADGIWMLSGLLAEVRMIARHCEEPRLIHGLTEKEWADICYEAETWPREAEPAPEAKPGTFHYYIAPSNHAAPGPFTWFVVNDSTASVEVHGVEDTWLEADRAAVVAIKEVEGEQ